MHSHEDSIGRRNPTGWLRDSNTGFENSCDAVELYPPIDLPLMEKKRDYFRNYHRSYFYQPFVTGIGAEQILGAIESFAEKGNWLDIGGGTTSLFWLLPAANRLSD